MHKDSAPEDLPNNVSDDDLEAITKSARPKIIYGEADSDGHTDKKLDVNGVIFLWHTNSPLPKRSEGPPTTPLKIREYNRFTYWTVASQKGFVVFGGDDHIATGANNVPYPDLIAVFRHPDVSASDLHKLNSTVRDQLGGKDTSSPLVTIEPEDRIVDPREYSEAIDGLIFTDERFENFRKVHEAHMQKVKETSAPPPNLV